MKRTHFSLQVQLIQVHLQSAVHDQLAFLQVSTSGTTAVLTFTSTLN